MNDRLNEKIKSSKFSVYCLSKYNLDMSYPNKKTKDGLGLAADGSKDKIP